MSYKDFDMNGPILPLGREARADRRLRRKRISEESEADAIQVVDKPDDGSDLAYIFRLTDTRLRNALNHTSKTEE